MDTFPTFVLGLAGIGVAGFVAWTLRAIGKVKDDLHDLERQVSREFVKRDAFDELRQEVRRMSNLMIEIAGKLGVPVRLE